MGVPTLCTSRFSREDEAVDQDESISQLVSRLRTAFRTADFNRVEEELVAREAKLKREIEKLKTENVILEEKHQFDQLEKLRIDQEVKERYEKLLEEVKSGIECDDKDAIFELRRKNSELQSENKKLEAKLNRAYEEFENRVSRLEADTTKLMNTRKRGSRIIEVSENSGTIVGNGNRNHSVTVTSSPVNAVIDVENVSELNGNGSMATGTLGSPLSDHLHSKRNGDPHASGVRKFSSGGEVLIIDSDDDCSLGDTMWQNKTSETSVEKSPKVLKRKRASSVSTNDNENGGDKFEQEFTPIGEMKQHLKSSLEPSSSLVNHCSEAFVASSINNPSSRDLVRVRQAEEKMWVGQGSREFLRSLAEGNDDCDGSDSSNSSSSSSDSKDDNRGLFLYADAMEKVKATKE